MRENKALVTINVEIESEGLKKLAEKGNLAAFVDSLPVMLATSIKAKLVDKLAAGGLQASHSVEYIIDDFPTGPWPWPGPWPGPMPWSR